MRAMKSNFVERLKPFQEVCKELGLHCGTSDYTNEWRFMLNMEDEYKAPWVVDLIDTHVRVRRFVPCVYHFIIEDHYGEPCLKDLMNYNTRRYKRTVTKDINEFRKALAEQVTLFKKYIVLKRQYQMEKDFRNDNGSAESDCC